MIQNSKYHYILSNKTVSLVPFKKKNITNEFINCLNNKFINKYLSYKKKQTKRSALRYFNERKKNNDYYLAIIKNYKKKVIGTMTLRVLDKNSAKIGYIMLKKKYFGSKYSINSFRMLLNFSFKTLKFRKIYAINNKNNIGSNFNLITCGFLLKKKTSRFFCFVLLKKNFGKKIKYEIS